MDTKVRDGAARWVAARALLAGEEPTVAIVAAVLDTSERALLRRIEGERWIVAARRGDDDTPAGERLDRVVSFLLAEVEEIGRAAEEKGTALDKARLDGVWAMIRAVEKVDGLAKERAESLAGKRDGDLAELLRRIDDRIFGLAQELAAGQLGASRMGIEEPGRSGSVGGPE